MASASAAGSNKKDDDNFLFVDYFLKHDLDEMSSKVEFFFSKEIVDVLQRKGVFTIYQLIGYFLVLCRNAFSKKDLENYIPSYNMWLEDFIGIKKEEIKTKITTVVYNKLYKAF